MNYSKILEELSNASLLELYRLQQAIRNSLKIGDKVACKDRKGNELLGEVIKLNQKTGGVLVGAGRWKVSYGMLSPLVEGELGNDANVIEGRLSDRE